MPLRLSNPFFFNFFIYFLVNSLISSLLRELVPLNPGSEELNSLLIIDARIALFIFFLENWLSVIFN